MDSNKGDDLLAEAKRQVHYPRYHHSGDGTSRHFPSTTCNPAPEERIADASNTPSGEQIPNADGPQQASRLVRDPPGHYPRKIGLDSNVEGSALKRGLANKRQTSIAGTHVIGAISHQISTSIASSQPAQDRGKQKLDKLNMYTGRQHKPGVYDNSTANRWQQKLAKLDIYIEPRSKRETVEKSKPEINFINRGKQKRAKLHAAIGRKPALEANLLVDASAPPHNTREVGSRREQKLAKLAAATGWQPRRGRTISTDIETGDPEGMEPADEEPSSLGNQPEPDPSNGLGVEDKSTGGAEIENPGGPVGRDPLVGNQSEQDTVDSLGVAVESRTEFENPERPVARDPPALEDPNSGLAVAHLVQEDTVHPERTVARDPPALEDPNSGLALANLVREDTVLILNLGALESQDVADMKEQGRLAMQQKTKRYLLCFASAGLLIVATIVLGAILARDQNKNIAVVLYPQEHPSLDSSHISRETRIYSLLPTTTVNAIEANRASPQALAWDWLEKDLPLHNYSDWRALQRLSLAVFFYSTGGPTYWDETFKGGWMDHEKHECHWEWRSSLFVYGDAGITATKNISLSNPCELNTTQVLNLDQDDGIVRNLWLWGINLHGILPPEIGMLTKIRSINLDPKEGDWKINQEVNDPNYGKLEKVSVWLHGRIPSQIGLCTDLEIIAVQANDFTGTIPTQLMALPSLSFLRLPYSLSIVTLPTEAGLMTSMKSLNLSASVGSLQNSVNFNRLQYYNGLYNGFSSLLTEMGLMTSMTSLDLSQNNLTSIPSEIGLMTDMQKLDVGSNRIRLLPSEVGLMTAMQSLTIGEANSVYITQDSLSSVPSEIGMLTAMQSLDLRNNGITSVPSEFGLMSNLLSLDLSRNNFTSLPTEIGLMTTLQSLIVRLFEKPLKFFGEINGWNVLTSIPSEVGMGWNVLTSIPSEVGLITAMQSLDLFNNELTVIPSELGLIRNLLSLDFSKNDITRLPSEIGLMTELRTLLLPENQLTGRVPSELGQMAKLSELILDDNKLSASLPSELGLMTSLSWLSLSRNQLSGSIPTELGVTPTLSRLMLDENSLSGLIPSELGLSSSLNIIVLKGNSLSGTFPNLAALNRSLVRLDVTNNALLVGEIPSKLCERRRNGPYTFRLMIFDCSDQLCGCDWCPCPEIFSEVLSSNSTLEPVDDPEEEVTSLMSQLDMAGYNFQCIGDDCL